MDAIDYFCCQRLICQKNVMLKKLLNKLDILDCKIMYPCLNWAGDKKFLKFLKIGR